MGIKFLCCFGAKIGKAVFYVLESGLERQFLLLFGIGDWEGIFLFLGGRDGKGSFVVFGEQGLEGSFVVDW